MKISLLTIFPEFFAGALAGGMIRAAREKGALEVGIVPLRDFTDDTHRTTDDYPFGGGAGMIMKVEPIDRALQSLAVGDKGARPRGLRVALFSPQGRAFTQPVAIEYAALDHLVLVCGRYKGVDERVSERLADEELSVGDFVLSGGEPAALCVLDAVARLLPGVVGRFDSVESDSFHSGLLDASYYTRPADYRGWSVPEVLLSGHHARIARARREESLRRTALRRPDLLAGARLGPEDRRYLARIGAGQADDGNTSGRAMRSEGTPPGETGITAAPAVRRRAGSAARPKRAAAPRKAAKRATAKRPGAKAARSAPRAAGKARARRRPERG